MHPIADSQAWHPQGVPLHFSDRAPYHNCDERINLCSNDTEQPGEALDEDQGHSRWLRGEVWRAVLCRVRTAYRYTIRDRYDSYPAPGHQSLAPVIRLFHGSVTGAISSATTTTLWLLLFYVLAIMLFVIIFTALATLAYNLVARFSGGLTLELREIGKKMEDGAPTINRGSAIGEGSTVEEGSAVEEVGKKREDGPPPEVIHETADGAPTINRGATGEEIPAAAEDFVSERNSPRSI